MDPCCSFGIERLPRQSLDDIEDLGCLLLASPVDAADFQLPLQFQPGLVHVLDVLELPIDLRVLVVDLAELAHFLAQACMLHSRPDLLEGHWRKATLRLGEL